MSSQKRINWPDATTRALMRVWQDNLSALRSNTRNARIYARILEEVNAGLPHGEGPYNMKQLRLKMKNLSKRYRKERLLCTRTGAGASKWRFYWLLHIFLGSLPVNDDLLVEENVEVPEVSEMPEEGVIVASWESTNNEDLADDMASANGPSESTDNNGDGDGCTPGGRNGTNTARKRKRPATTVQLLLARHDEEAKHTRKTDKKRLKLMKQLLQLQAEANDLNGSMLRMMDKYFEAKAKDK
ncbi:hypothetical protein HPB49_010190 [Dermacentor silvarum]|uniref:Uncharacterized protein n=1 Tax=Dermacentor silvarum TaxID=543639 RepID=A0ACB8C2Y9_DERSI|nr:hypothetical protein HPB49_010190 [Dermacentor silvarum]